MNIALWEYKEFGMRLSESLSKYWEDRYRVTAIYDQSRAGRHDPFWDIDVADTSMIKADHEKGLFEKIIVCVVDKPSRDRIIEDLNAQGVCALFPGDPSDFVPPEEFGGETVISDDDFTIHRYKEVFAAHADHLAWECTYIFNEEGRILGSPWNIHKRYDPEIPLIYPFPLKDPKPEKIQMQGSYCLLTKIYGNNYWHFTFQSLCDAYLLEKNGFTGTYVISNAKHNRELLIMLGIAPERIMSIDELEFHKVYVFEELYSVHIDHMDTVREGRILAEVSSAIKGRLKRDPSYPRFIYVKRIGARKLLNGDDLAEKFGFVTMIPEQLSVKEQMELFYNADIVFCPHGANSTNCLYMHEGSVFIEVFSDQWYMDINSAVCRENHVHHYKPVGKGRGIANSGMHDDYLIEEYKILPIFRIAFDLIPDPPVWPRSETRDIEDKKLEEACSRSSGILIYGAWVLGEKAFGMVMDFDKEKLMGFAVSSTKGNPAVKNGYPVHTVDEWKNMLMDTKILPENVTVIMALNQRFYEEVLKSLKEKGFKNIFMLEELEWYCRHQKKKKTYQTGLLMGVFDLFHIGHLNLIKRAKERCRYLRVGVLADELVNEFKSHYPVIPQNERMEILRELRDVDDVVLIETKDDVYRPNEWRKRPFDCFFSGDDYADNESWKREKEELKKLGVDMVFFPYTKERSSTMIREEISKSKQHAHG